MNNKEKIKNTLYGALKKDIAIEISRLNEEYCTLFIYKLDSVYNDIYTLHFDDDYYYKNGYEITKEKEKIGKKLLYLIKNRIETKGEKSIEEIEKIFLAFNELSSQIYYIKYSINTLQSIWNL